MSSQSIGFKETYLIELRDKKTGRLKLKKKVTGDGEETILFEEEK